MKRLGIVVFASVLPALGQHITGSISGTVEDPSGSAIVGANVTLTNTGTTAQQTSVTADGGRFEFLSLVPGTYDLSIQSPGFKRLRKTGLSLSANQRLSTGSINEPVESLSPLADCADRACEG